MVVVSIALPVYNAQDFLEDCFNSILNQTRKLSCNKATDKAAIQTTCNVSTEEAFEIEVSLYEDGSTDNSPIIIEKWKVIFRDTLGFSVRFSNNTTGQPKGVGYGRNRSIKQSTGDYICFCDADDIMEPGRISAQLSLCIDNPVAIVGSRFQRLPSDSTKNFTYWANSLSEIQLQTQIYLTFGPTVIMPTWFCHRSVYDGVQGGFDEGGKGVPEDLIFFYKHLDVGGQVVRANEQLVVYRYHPNATTFSVTDEVIWRLRLSRLEQKVLQNWSKFSIWNAGKLGRRLYRSLSKSCQNKVTCFCDVDKKKINQKWYHPYPIKVKVPIVPVKDAPPPFIICVKTELTWDAKGDFRQLLDSLNLQEGVDYFYFN